MLRVPPVVRRAAVRGYQAAVHDHFNNPRNIGKLDATKKNVGTGMVGAPACGDVMKLMIEVNINMIIQTLYVFQRLMIMMSLSMLNSKHLAVAVPSHPLR